MLKQQNAYFVPWPDTVEWKEVREKVLSENVSDMIRAYEMIQTWKLRCDDLPVYVESTAGILQVMIREHLRSGEVSSLLEEQDLKMSYSTALIRFVNHVHSASEWRGDTLYRAAKTQNIPDWIVSMRHDAAHGQNLPSLGTLRLAAEVALKWLLKNYWLSEDLNMRDYDPSGKVSEIEVEADKLHLQPIFKIALKFWMLCLKTDCSKQEFLFKLTPEEWRSLRLLKNLCAENDYIQKQAPLFVKSLGSYFKCFKRVKREFNNCPNAKLPSLKLKLLNLMKSAASNNSAKNALIQSLLESNFIADTSKDKWQQLINLIQDMGSLTYLIKSIFRLAADGNEKAKNFLAKFLSSIEEARSLRKRKPGKGDVYVLSQQKPPEITLTMVQDLLMNPSDYPMHLIRRYLRLVQPPLPEEVLGHLEKLINIYMGVGKSQEVSSDSDVQIYTVEDLTKGEQQGSTSERASGVAATNDIGGNGSEAVASSSRPKTEKTVEGLKREEREPSVEPLEEPSKEIRSLHAEILSALFSSGEDVWSRCPMGLLPHQAVVDCKLPDNLKWKSKRASSSSSSSSSSCLKRRSLPSLAKHATEMKKCRFDNETNVPVITCE